MASDTHNKDEQKKIKMINRYKIPAVIIQEIPEIEPELKATFPSLNIFKTIGCLAGYTKKCVREHNIKSVGKALKIAEHIYDKGDQEVRNAVENVFVFSFTSMFSMCNKDEQIELHSLMPLHLYSAYILQTYRSNN